MKRVLALAFLSCSLFGIRSAAAQQAPKVPEDVELLRNVEFGKGGKQTLTMHIVRPKVPPKGPMPVLVYINGSAWMRDNKDLAIGRLIATAQQGYFGATIQVRTSGETVFPGMLEDAKCAVRFLRAKAKEYRLDTERIGIWGDSSGGHLAAMVGLTADVKEFEGTGGWAEHSSRVHAVCSMCPAIDFLVPDWPGRHNDAGGSVFRLLGGDPRKDKGELARKASPLSYVKKDSPPFFIVHGNKDTTVPYSQGELLRDALKKAGVEVAFHTVPGGNHGSVHQQDKIVVKEFFDKRFKEKTPVGNARTSDKAATNSVGMKLILIPNGEFMMGSRELPSELPIHKVRITKDSLRL